MGRLGLALVLLGFVSSATGCAMCSNPYDCFYGAYGGTWPREDMTSGRVGSAFSPAGSHVLESEAPVPAPTPASGPSGQFDSGDPSIEPILKQRSSTLLEDCRVWLLSLDT